jgi:8-oxo-dGTP pyrophosphatase MutT (NUDIX family)
VNAVPVRDAATVVLLRDGSAGVEAWLLTRVTQMVFAAGMTVFPGGRVDVADAEVAWSGRPASQFAARFGCDERLARSLVAAAVRETFEETGVLLTSPVADLSAARADVEAGHLPFAALLREHGLALDADTVRPWGRWITPEGEVRRYDARFFVAALPDGAQAEDVTSESSVAGWLRVADALAELERGERTMLPPTMLTLQSLAGFADVEAVLAAADDRDLGPVRPVLRHGADGPSVELPDGTRVRIPKSMLA